MYMLTFQGLVWFSKHSQSHPEQFGFIPTFLNADDARPAAEQIREKYIGGWDNFKGFTQLENGDLAYPGDPNMVTLWETKLRDEIVRLHDASWVSITQPDGSFEVSRLD